MNNIKSLFNEIEQPVVVEEVVETVVPTEITVLKVASQRLAWWKGNRKITAKYFRNASGHSIDRMRAVITPQEYNDYVKDMTVKEINKDFSTASSYFKRKVLSSIMKKDFGVDEIDWSDYRSAEENFEMFHQFDNDEVIEERRLAEFEEAKERMFRQGIPTPVFVDLDKLNIIEQAMLTLVRSRKIILFDLENLAGIVRGVYEETNGFSQNPSAELSEALDGAYRKLMKFAKISKAQEILANASGDLHEALHDFKHNGKFLTEAEIDIQIVLFRDLNDLHMFTVDNPSDYINTYQKVLRGLGWSPDVMDIADIRAIIHNPKDIMEEHILAFNQVVEPVYDSYGECDEDFDEIDLD